VDEPEFYQRSYVKEIRRIFGDPAPPSKVTEKQFDGFDGDLELLARTPWHEISCDQWWYYLMDLAYNPLQKDLFDYLFPAFLAIWREGLDLRVEQPASECDFYYSIWRGEVFWKMMNEARREAVFAWMVEGFRSAVDTIKPEEAIAIEGRNDRLHFFPWALNAIGQSLCILPRILDCLLSDLTPGKSRYWLIVASGLAWPENGVPWVKPWNPQGGGGGGIYLLESSAAIYETGFVPENLASYRERFTLGVLEDLLTQFLSLPLEPDEFERIEQCLSRLKTHQGAVQAKFAWYMDQLGRPHLGGIQKEPTFFG